MWISDPSCRLAEQRVVGVVEGEQKGGAMTAPTVGRRAIQVQDWISVVLLAACFWIGQVQASDAPRSFLTSYGADLVGPVALYWPLRRTLFREHPNGSEVTVLVVLAGCFAWEFSQLLEWGSLPPAIAAGTFDVWDLLAYAASLVAGYALDIGMRRTA
jgi:hypothetical protein